MSESQFYAEQLAKCHQENPQSDGWSVCEVRPFCRLELDGLPDFLPQAKSATAIKTKITRAIIRDAVKSALDESAPGAFKEKGWVGDKESRSALPRMGNPNDGVGFHVKAEA